ncbi:4-vinyl reductase [Anaerolineales bacterium HSG6]|nr:4-vinyl reductase [Anaerolineales bacterium HSG6]MDM8531970.1 4-vinyl reductase [Anaerolineales bacterium HSG25]
MAEPSGLFYPNLMARIYLQALEEVMGKNGINALLNLAKLPQLIDNYPPANLNKEFDFADFGALGQGIVDMYGPRGGRGLALRAGRASFADGLSKFGATAGAADLAFKVLPTGTKLKVGLKALAETFTKFSDQHSSLAEDGDHFVYTIHQCPVCWGRKEAKPICYGAIGILQEGLRWVSGGKDFRVEEMECVATGHENCVLHIFKEPL